MRIVLLYIPALICAGSMIICVRMMSRGHGNAANDRHHDDRPAESRDDQHVT